jgi:hypothetical protein
MFGGSAIEITAGKHITSVSLDPSLGGGMFTSDVVLFT